jgi:hypothetical protein
MTAVKTNKSGRPRKFEVDVLSEMILEWAEKPSSINLCGFCSEHMIDPVYLYACRNTVGFSEAYYLTKIKIAERREMYHNLGRITPTAYGRQLRNYDCFLDHFEKENYEYETSVSKKAEQNAQPIDKIEIVDYKKALDV